MRWTTWLLICGVILGSIATGAWLAGAPREEIATFTIPALQPGASATYETAGRFRTLDDPAMLAGAVRGPLDGGEIRLEVLQARLPAPDGRWELATIVRAIDETGAPFLTFASMPGEPTLQALAEQKTPRAPTYSDLDHEVTFGPMDVLLLEGTTHEPGEVPLGSVQAWARDAWHPVRRAHLETSLQANPQSRGEQPHLDLEIQVEISAPDDQAGTTSRVGGGFVLQPRLSETTNASYRFTPGCTFPAEIRYETDGEVTFEARRTACAVEAWDGADQGAEGRAWPAIPEEGFVRRYPGTGETLPLPYQPASSFFLDLPESQLFESDHPDWYLHCAVMVKPAARQAPYHPWSWWFELREGNATHGGWVTKLQADPGTPTPNLPTWVKEPREDGYACSPDDLSGFFDQPTAYSSLDEKVEAFRWILPPERYEGSAEWTLLEIDPTGTTFFLNRCRTASETFCLDTLAGVAFHPDGTLRNLNAEPTWLADPYRELVT